MSGNTLGADLSFNPAIPEESGRQLEDLADLGWRVLHSVPLGANGPMVNHLLIGPAGVFTVFCRAFPKQRVEIFPMTMTVDGESVPYIHEARLGALRAKRYLDRALGWSVPVRPALGLYTASRLPRVSVHDDGPTDVLILYRSGVGRKFKQMAGLLEPHQVDEVYAKARWSENWILPEEL